MPCPGGSHWDKLEKNFTELSSATLKVELTQRARCSTAFPKILIPAQGAAARVKERDEDAKGPSARSDWE